MTVVEQAAVRMVIILLFGGCCVLFIHLLYSEHRSNRPRRTQCLRNSRKLRALLKDLV